MHKRIISATAAMMAATMLFTGCASQEIQDRKAAAEAAAVAATQPTPSPAPTPEPTPEPIDAWSLLDNLPDFAVGTLDSPFMTWVDGLPMGEDILTFEDGQYVSGLYSVSDKTLLKDVSLNELNTMPISGYLKLSELENGNTVIDSVNDAATSDGIEKDLSDFCVQTNGPDGTANYYQIGYNDGWLSNIFNTEAASTDGITFSDAFADGMFYSSAAPTAFNGFNADGTPEEQFESLYTIFGDPSGLYWTNNGGSKQYTSFEEFRDAEYDSSYGAKNFYLVWNYDGYSIVAACSDLFDSADVKGTTISDIYMFPILNGSLYLKESDTSNFWGYLGYGDAPARLTGLCTSVPGASDVAIDDTANSTSTDTENGTTPNSDLENAASEDAVSDTPEIVDDGAISDGTAPSED